MRSNEQAEAGLFVHRICPVPLCQKPPFMA